MLEEVIIENKAGASVLKKCVKTKQQDVTELRTEDLKVKVSNKLSGG